MAGFFSNLGKLFTGTPAKHERVSTLLPEQQGLYNQLLNAGMSGGGAFGNAANYYRNLLSDNSADYQAFAAPQMRQFREDIIPGIAEQFAGMGSGALSSSGFRNASVNAGTDLAERLGAIRANLRQAGAQGLQNIGQLGLQNFSQDVMTDPGSPGLLGNLSPAIGNILGSFGGPIGTAIGGMGSNWLKNSFGSDTVGKKTSPYQNSVPIGIQPRANQGLQLPGFLQR